MTNFLLLCLWLFMAYAEQIFAACFYGVAAVVWGMAGALGLLVVWIFSNR